jgi:acetyl esterase/lipase
MEILKQVILTSKNIWQDFRTDNELNSKNWGVMHRFTAKFLKSMFKETNNLPISVWQSFTRACKHLPWPGLEIERSAVPNKFREQAYQFLKKYFEDKYGQYPVSIKYHWNTSTPLNIQWLTPKNRKMAYQPPTLYHIHGGAWMLMHSCLDNHIFSELTEASSSKIMAIDYRLLPQYPLLSQIEDIFAGYFYLIASELEGGAGRKSSEIVVGGYSSGGQLVASLLHTLRNANLSSPAGAYLISPALDLTFSQPSFFTNTKRDTLWRQHSLPTIDKSGQNFYGNVNNEVYGHSPPKVVERIIKDGSMFGPVETLLWPELSTLFDTNMSNLPPTIVLVGERDSLRDTGVLYGKLRAEAEIKSKNKTAIIPNIQTYNYEDMTHAFPVFLPDKYTKKAIKTVGEFVYQALNANDQRLLDERSYKYLPNYKIAYMNSTYNMYWNDIKNNYSPWNSSYDVYAFPTTKNFTDSSSINPYRNQTLPILGL